VRPGPPSGGWYSNSVRAYSWNIPAAEAAAEAAAARVEYPVVDTASRKSIGWRMKLMIRSSSSLSRVGLAISSNCLQNGHWKSI